VLAARAAVPAARVQVRVVPEPAAAPGAAVPDQAVELAQAVPDRVAAA